MNDDLIRRSDAIKAVRHISMEFVDADTRQKLIEAIPAIEPKRGEWIEDYNNTYGRCRMKCSVCGKFSGIGGIKSNQRKPFCPNCGCAMTKE